MRLGDLQPGAYFTVWHQTFGGSQPESALFYSRVTKRNRTTSWVRTEHGDHKKIDQSLTVMPVAEGHWHPEISAEPPKQESLSKAFAAAIKAERELAAALNKAGYHVYEAAVRHYLQELKNTRLAISENKTPTI